MDNVPTKSAGFYWANDGNGNFTYSDKEIAAISGGESGFFALTTSPDAYENAPWKDAGSVNSTKLKTFKPDKNSGTISKDNLLTMQGMFDHCTSLKTLDLSNFDTSNVIDMSGMFAYCTSLKTLDLSNFDTSNVENMSNMFDHCSSLETISLSNFDTSNVENMSGMFDCCTNLFSLDISKFSTHRSTNTYIMFGDESTTCKNLKVISLNDGEKSKAIINSLPFDTWYDENTHKAFSKTEMLSAKANAWFSDPALFNISTNIAQLSRMQMQIAKKSNEHSSDISKIKSEIKKVANAGTYTLPAATSTALGGIKVGSNLSITDDGTLSATGGASSGFDPATFSPVTIGNGASFSGTPGTDTVVGLDASAVGDNATAYGTKAKAAMKGATAVGHSATVSSTASGANCGTAIGSNASAKNNYTTAVGYAATVSGAQSDGFGAMTSVTGISSVALGYGSTASANSVVSVGSGVSSSSYGTRRIINVKDPTDAQDAATKAYVDALIAKLKSDNNLN